MMSYSEPLKYQFHLNNTISDRSHFLSDFFLKEYGLINFQSIEVLHGGFAHALILEHEKGTKKTRSDQKNFFFFIRKK